MSEIIIAFISGSIVAILASFLAHILSERRDRLKEFNQAATEFKSTFIPEIRYLDYRYSPDRRDMPGVYTTLSNAFDRHEIAIIKFRLYLNRCERIGFDRVWDKYKYCNKKDNKPYFMIYSEPNNILKKDKAKKEALEKLESILTFANPK